MGIATRPLPVPRCPGLKLTQTLHLIFFHSCSSSCSPALPLPAGAACLSHSNKPSHSSLSPPRHPLTAVCGSCTGDDSGAPAQPALSRSSPHWGGGLHQQPAHSLTSLQLAELPLCTYALGPILGHLGKACHYMVGEITVWYSLSLMPCYLGGLCTTVYLCT